MEKYNLTPELEARVNAMTYEERAVFWNEGEYRAYMETLPVPTLLTMANSSDAIRTDARVVLMKKMEDAGLLDGMARCCGTRFDWRTTAQALAHIKHSPCPAGFTIVEGMCVCDCKRKCASPEEAHAHTMRVGNCLHERKRKQALYCVICEHQSDTKKQYDDHIATKTHLKKANPINTTCDTCEITCRTLKEYERHCAGKHHRYKVNPPVLTCACCNITCLSVKQMEAHTRTAKHTRNASQS